jgi:hypothetical protein
MAHRSRRRHTGVGACTKGGRYFRGVTNAKDFGFRQPSSKLFRFDSLKCNIFCITPLEMQNRLDLRVGLVHARPLTGPPISAKSAGMLLLRWKGVIQFLPCVFYSCCALCLLPMSTLFNFLTLMHLIPLIRLALNAASLDCTFSRGETAR